MHLPFAKPFKTRHFFQKEIIGDMFTINITIGKRIYLILLSHKLTSLLQAESSLGAIHTIPVYEDVHLV